MTLTEVRDMLSMLNKIIGESKMLSENCEGFYRDAVGDESAAEYYRGKKDAYEQIHKLISDLALSGITSEGKLLAGDD